MTKRAVIFGGGNIGRGFIGQLFCESGYEVVFVDVDEELMAALNRDRKYRLEAVSNAGVESFEIGPVRAVSSSDVGAVATAVAEAEIGATAVGANALKFIVPNLAVGLARRAAAGAAPINFIICENLHGAAAHVRDLVTAVTPPEALSYVQEKTGFVDTVIGRMVPVPTPEMRARDVSLVRVEPYKELPVDRTGFVGSIPTISAMTAYDDFGVFTARKLYIHNCGHALMAYVGYLHGYELGYEAVADLAVRGFMLAGLQESVKGISAAFNADPAWLNAHVDDLLGRFANRMLGDTIFRLGRDPVRKLAAEDRLTGAANLVCQCGEKPVHLAWGMAAALLFAPAGDPSAEKLQAAIKEKGPEQALFEVSGVAPGSVLGQLVMDAYGKLCQNPKALP